MTDNDKQSFFEIMAGTADNFGGQISKEGFRLRFSALKHLDIETLSKAASWILSNRDPKAYPNVPTIREFMDAAEIVTKGVKLLPCDAAEIQAGLIIGMLKRDGRSASLEGLDDIAKHLMSRRWKYPSWAANVLESDLVWWRKEFIEAYKANSESGKVDESNMLLDMARNLEIQGKKIQLQAKHDRLDEGRSLMLAP